MGEKLMSSKELMDPGVHPDVNNDSKNSNTFAACQHIFCDIRNHSHHHHHHLVPMISTKHVLALIQLCAEPVLPLRKGLCRNCSSFKKT